MIGAKAPWRSGGEEHPRTETRLPSPRQARTPSGDRGGRGRERTARRR